MQKIAKESDRDFTSKHNSDHIYDVSIIELDSAVQNVYKTLARKFGRKQAAEKLGINENRFNNYYLGRQNSIYFAEFKKAVDELSKIVSQDELRKILGSNNGCNIYDLDFKIAKVSVGIVRSLIREEIKKRQKTKGKQYDDIVEDLGSELGKDPRTIKRYISESQDVIKFVDYEVYERLSENKPKSFLFKVGDLLSIALCDSYEMFNVYNRRNIRLTKEQFYRIKDSLRKGNWHPV